MTTLNLNLPPELEHLLTQAAQMRGITPERLALEDLARLYAPASTNGNNNGSGAHIPADLLEDEAFIKRNRVAVANALRLIPPGVTVYHDADFMFGPWTAEEAAEFEEGVALFEQIDEEVWR